MKYLFLLLFVGLVVFADTLTYVLKGEYNIPHEGKVKYVLTWKETKGSVKGLYQDDRSIKKAEVKGVATGTGREFNVVFPKKSYQANGLRLTTIQVKGAQTTTVPVQLELIGDTSDKIQNLKAVFHGRP